MGIGVSLVRKTDRIFVAGSRGLVGSAIWRALSKRGFANLVGRTSAELDLRNQEAVLKFFERERPDAVVLAAAKVGGILANASHPVEFLTDNLRIQLNVMDAARSVRTGRLLFLGSSCIYPKFAPQPIREECLLTGKLEPTNEAYAIAKIAGIMQVQAMRQEDGLAYVSAMPTNLYGPGDNFDLAESHVLPALIRRFHEAKRAGSNELVVWGTGEVRREFMHVDDMARACIEVLEWYDDPEPINIGVGEDISIAEAAETVARVVGFGGRVAFDATKPDGTPRKLLDVRKLNELGFAPRISLESGLASVYRWYLESGLVDRTADHPSAPFGMPLVVKDVRSQPIRVGDYVVAESEAWSYIQRYAESEAVAIKYFDCNGGATAVPEPSVGLNTFARLGFLEYSLSAGEAVALIDGTKGAPWGMLAGGARLLDAEPDEEGGLYDAAETGYRHYYRSAPRVSPGALSGVLHLQRPCLFPLLDVKIRRLYDHRAADAWEASKKEERPRSRRNYWPVVREDLIDGREQLGVWRTRLARSDSLEERMLATVTDVRLWDSLARSLAAAKGLKAYWADNVPNPT